MNDPKSIEEWQGRWREKSRVVYADPSSSYALIRAVVEFMDRDPVDAANDAEFLHSFMKQRADELAAVHDGSRNELEKPM